MFVSTAVRDGMRKTGTKSVPCCAQLISMLVIVVLLATCVQPKAPPSSPPPATGAAARWCDELPRPENAALERVAVTTDWFQVYRAADGVFALTEPFSFRKRFRI
jgi:hypothetical protein